MSERLDIQKCMLYKLSVTMPMCVGLYPVAPIVGGVFQDELPAGLLISSSHPLGRAVYLAMRLDINIKG